MRRPRSRLTVSTFPFLAVLLCAMGALILLLLVFDRRAKEAAKARAEARAQAEHDSARAEHEQKLKKILAMDDAARKEARDKSLVRRGRIEKDLAETKAKADSVREAMRRAGMILAEASAAAEADRAASEKARDAIGKMEARRNEVVEIRRKAGEQKTKVDEERSRQERDLARLEAVLARVSAERERDKQTFSIVPYRGKQGENRKPLYIECTARGLVFLPDRLEVDPVAHPRRALDEIDRRADEQNRRHQAMGIPVSRRPYLMLLVRPEGIGAYYRFQVLTRPYDIDFGYELVDADWVLDIPPEPGQEVAGSPPSVPKGAPGATVARSNGVRLSGGQPGSGGFDFQPGALVPGDGSGGSGSGHGQGPANGALVGQGNGNRSPLVSGSGGAGGINFGAGSGAGPGQGTGIGGIPGGAGTGNGVGIQGGFPGAGVAPGSGGSPGGGIPGPGLGGGPGLGQAGMPGVPGAVGTGGVGTGIAGGLENRSGNGDIPGAVPPRLGLEFDGGGSPSGGGSGLSGNGGRAPSGGGSGPSVVGGGGSPSGAGSGDEPSGNGSGAGGTGGSGGVGLGGGSPSGSGSGNRNGSGSPSGTDTGLAGGGGSPPGSGSSSESSGAGGTTGAAGAGMAGSPGAGTPGAGMVLGNPGGPLGPITGPPPLPPPNPTRPDQRRDDDQPSPGGASGSGSPSGIAGGASGGGLPDPDAEDLAPLGRVLVPLPRAPEKNPPSRPMKLAKLSGPVELVMFVECRADGATVHPGGRKFGIAELSSANNPLIEELKRQMDRRQALARPGELLPKPHVRYLVWNDGLRSYHAIYPLLRSWDVTKSQQSIESKEELREALRQ